MSREGIEIKISKYKNGERDEGFAGAGSGKSSFEAWSHAMRMIKGMIERSQIYEENYRLSWSNFVVEPNIQIRVEDKDETAA